MDESWEKWLSDMEMDDCHLFSESDIKFLEEVLKGEIIGIHNNKCDLKKHDSSEKSPFSSSMSYMLQRNPYSLNPQYFTAEPNNVPNKTWPHHNEHSEGTREENESRKPKRKRSASQLRDHIIAERKRREHITQMFIALSGIIPGLKKMDQISILGNTIDHVKHLQRRVKDVEEQIERRKMEDVACLKNKEVSDNISCDLDRSMKTFSNVKAFALGKDIAIRVVCDVKGKEIVTKLMSKLAAHNLSIVCSNVMPFGNSTVITIITKVDREFNMAMDDLEKILNEDLLLEVV